MKILNPENRMEMLDNVGHLLFRTSNMLSALSMCKLYDEQSEVRIHRPELFRTEDYYGEEYEWWYIAVYRKKDEKFVGWVAKDL